MKSPVILNGYCKSKAEREKGRDLTQSYDKNSFIHKNLKQQRDNTKTQPKTLQRLRTDFGGSVVVTTATQLVWY